MKKVILFVIALASVSALSGCVWPFWGPGGDARDIWALAAAVGLAAVHTGNTRWPHQEAIVCIAIRIILTLHLRPLSAHAFAGDSPLFMTNLSTS